MPRSSGFYIAYDLRPAKQSERRILLDILKIAGDCGLPITNYRYVGMGANRFYDFLLTHKYLGIDNMVSIEHDSAMFERANFNVPYRFITVLETSVADFIASDVARDASIYWFDYDGGIGPSIIQDIFSLTQKLKLGDFCFVTVGGYQPRALEREARTGPDRLNWLKDNIGDVAGDVNVDDTQESNFPNAIHKMIMSAFKNASAQRRDGTFVPLLQVRYTDSMPMVTIGGALLADGQTQAFHKRIGQAMPFLKTEQSYLYQIRSLNITERERHLFDRAVTSRTARCSERNLLKKIGFSDNDLLAYKDLVRYLPRYVETMV